MALNTVFKGLHTVFTPLHTHTHTPTRAHPWHGLQGRGVWGAATGCASHPRTGGGLGSSHGGSKMAHHTYNTTGLACGEGMPHHGQREGRTHHEAQARHEARQRAMRERAAWWEGQARAVALRRHGALLVLLLLVLLLLVWVWGLCFCAGP